jgi:hypothetical protein
MPDYGQNHLSLEEHLELGREVKRCKARLRELSNLVVEVYGQGSRPGASFLSTLAALERLYSGDPRAINSLALIRSYRLATSLMVGLKKLLPHCDYRDRRIHTKVRDTQATGRISSTTPPLQNVSKAQKVAGVEIISRNALVAQEGFVFCDFDVKQADVRVMAHHVAAFPCRAKLYTGDHAERQNCRYSNGILRLYYIN